MSNEYVTILTFCMNALYRILPKLYVNDILMLWGNEGIKEKERNGGGEKQLSPIHRWNE